MSNTDKALLTQIRNIESKTGKTLAELTGLVRSSSLSKHSELVTMLKMELGLGHGDANTVVHLAKKAAEGGGEGAGEESAEAAVSRIYAGKHESQLPIHKAVMKRIKKLGPFEIAPKKKYLSLRRKKQFAMVGPGSKGRVEVGFNMKNVDATSRLESLPPGGMCQYRVFLTQVSDVDDEFMEWVKTAYNSSE